VFESDTSKKLYIDGVLVNNLTTPVTFNNGVNAVYIGALMVKTSPNSYFNGQIDDVRIYNRALSDAEIQTLFNLPPPNQPPTVAIAANPTSGTAPLAVNFTATASDPDGTIASYAWDFGDNTSATIQNPSHTYASAETYTATLTVTDNSGATASATATITVNAPAVLTPSITLAKSADKTTATTGDTITYTIQYENTGQGEAKNVVITDPIPQGTTYIDKSATQNGVYDTNKNQLTWTIPSLPAGAKGSVSFQVRVE
jgi:uncharacterized repeat protein (TIGR01451 family)